MTSYNFEDIEKWNFCIDNNNYEIDFKRNTLKTASYTKELSRNPIKLPGANYYKLNSKCNLNCIYCFQKDDGNDNQSNEMNFEVLKNFKNESNINILFGGEPFLDRNIEYLKRLFNDNELENFHVYTNGVFSDSIFELLKTNINAIRSMTISIDGPERIHNKRRVSHKFNSYRKVIDNINKLKITGIFIGIQINVDNNNFMYVEELLLNLNKDITNDNIVVFLNRVCGLEVDFRESDLLELYSNIDSSFLNYRLDVNSGILRNIRNYLLDKGKTYERCGIGKTKVLDFERNSIYTCPHNIYTEIGVIEKGSIEIDSDKKSRFLSKNNCPTMYCLHCNYYGICNEGCVVYLNNKCIIETEKCLKLIISNPIKFNLELTI